MRVLFITNLFPPGNYVGGAEVANYHLGRGLIRRGVDCAFLVLNNRLPVTVDERYTLGGLPVHRLNFATPRRLSLTDVFDSRIYTAVRREISHWQPDLVHIMNVSGATLAPYVACQRAGVPMVNTLHDLWLLCASNMLYRTDGTQCNPAQGRGRCRQCFRRYDFWADIPFRRSVFAALTAHVRLFVSPSQALVDRHVLAGYDPRRFRLVRYSIESDEPEGASAPSGLRDIIETASDFQTVTYAGGGVESKGAQTVIEAIPLLLRHSNRLRILVAGSGEPRFLEQLWRYAPRVRELGRVPFRDMAALYAASDLVLVPSVWHENSPVVIYQSFQVGVPVVGSRLGGTPELIREGETGYLFPAGEPEALAEKILLHFASSAAERRRMRQNCIREARTRLAPEPGVEAMLAVYHEALTQGEEPRQGG